MNDNERAGCLGVIILVAIVCIGPLLVMYWPFVLVVLGIIAIAATVYFISVRVEKNREKERLELEAIQKEQERKDELVNLLNTPKPVPVLINFQKKSSYDSAEEERVNNQYSRIIDLYNLYLVEENNYNWLSNRKKWYDELNKLNNSQFNNININETLENAKKQLEIAQNNFKTARLKIPNVPKKLKNRINEKQQQLLNIIKNGLDNGHLNEFEEQIFSSYEKLSTEKGILCFCDMYCIWTRKNIAMDYYPIEIIRYDKLSVTESTYTTTTHRLSYGDILLKTRYRHENADGSRNKRYSTENNPAYYEVRRGTVFLGIPNYDKFSFDFKKGTAKAIIQSFIDLYKEDDVIKAVSSLLALSADKFDYSKFERQLLEEKRKKEQEEAVERERRRQEEREKERKRQEELKKIKEENEKRLAEQAKKEAEMQLEKQRLREEWQKQQEEKRIAAEKEKEQKAIKRQQEVEKLRAEHQKTEPTHTYAVNGEQLSNEEILMILNMRKEKQLKKQADEKQAKANAQAVKLAEIKEATFSQNDGKNTITNNIFKLCFKQNKEETKSKQYLIYFVANDGTVVSNEITTNVRKVGEEFTESFELIAKYDFSNSEKYYLLVKNVETNEIVGKLEYTIKISFASDFDF